MKNRIPFSTVLLFALAFLAACSLPSEAATWQQTRRIQPERVTSTFDFGRSASLVDGVAVIGSPAAEDPFLIWSHAYTYSTNTGDQLVELQPEWPVGNGFGGRFGFSTGTDGNSIIVGAGPEQIFPDATGGAFVFDSTTGEQIAELIPEGINRYSKYGYSVAISGNRAIVGAPGGGNVFPFSPGSAYLFNVETEQLIAELMAPAVPYHNQNYFGDSVAINDQFAIVGGISGPRAVYLYDAQTGESLGQLVPDNSARGFGTAVAMSGGVAIVGASGDRSDSPGGSAYLFDLESGEQLFELQSDDIAQGDQFGGSVAISGNLALVGAIGNDDQGSFSGSAYLFDVTTGEQLAKFIADDLHVSSEFGRSVAIDGQTILIGAPATGADYGAAYVFELVPEPSSLLCLLLGIVTLLPFNGRRCGC